MVRCTLSDLWKWMLTKVTLAVAAIFLEKQQTKSAEPLIQVSESMKDKKKHVMSGSSETSLDREIQELENLLKPLTNNDFNIDLKNNSEVDLEAVEEALQQILESDWGSEALGDISTPMYMLDLDKDSIMAYSINRKSYVSVRNHTEVIPVENPFDTESDSYFYVINNEVFDIDEDKVVCIGWN